MFITKLFRFVCLMAAYIQR